MRSLVPLFPAVLCLAGCAVAFSPGAAPAPSPEKFLDTDHSAAREVEKKQAATGARTEGTPTVGLSFVVGGAAMDAGALPKPPFPIVLVH